jgi:hypothetical protein
VAKNSPQRGGHTSTPLQDRQTARLATHSCIKVFRLYHEPNSPNTPSTYAAATHPQKAGMWRERQASIYSTVTMLDIVSCSSVPNPTSRALNYDEEQSSVGVRNRRGKNYGPHVTKFISLCSLLGSGRRMSNRKTASGQ